MSRRFLLQNKSITVVPRRALGSGNAGAAVLTHGGHGRRLAGFIRTVTHEEDRDA